MLAPRPTRSSPGSDPTTGHHHAGPTRHRVGPASSPPADVTDTVRRAAARVASAAPRRHRGPGRPPRGSGRAPATRSTGSAPSSGRWRTPRCTASSPCPRTWPPAGSGTRPPSWSRCFALGMPVATADLDRALPALTAVAGAVALGLVERGRRRGPSAPATCAPTATRRTTGGSCPTSPRSPAADRCLRTTSSASGRASTTVAQWTPRPPRAAGPSTSAPAAGSRRCTSPDAQRARSSPPTSPSGRSPSPGSPRRSPACRLDLRAGESPRPGGRASGSTSS